jgi:uncharacterized LabA/DUF88 family protein
MPMAEKIFAYIDGTNLHLSTVNMGWKLGQRRFRQFLKDKYGVTIAYYFIGYVEKYKNIHDNLRRNGFTLITFIPTIKPNGEIKGNCDANLVTKAMIDFAEYDKAVIVASDGDYEDLVKHLKNKNKLERVIACSRGGCARKLQRAAGSLIDYMDDFKEKIEYKPKGNPLRTKP